MARRARPGPNLRIHAAGTTGPATFQRHAALRAYAAMFPGRGKNFEPIAWTVCPDASATLALSWIFRGFILRDGAEFIILAAMLTRLSDSTFTLKYPSTDALFRGGYNEGIYIEFPSCGRLYRRRHDLGHL